MAELAPDAGAKRVAREMAERMGKAMNHWSGERVSHRFYRKPAEEIYRLLLSEWKHR
jgi:hypothetical protein